MHIEFSLEAKAEFEDSERYHECQVQGLGAHFRIAHRIIGSTVANQAPRTSCNSENYIHSFQRLTSVKSGMHH